MKKIVFLLTVAFSMSCSTDDAGSGLTTAELLIGSWETTKVTISAHVGTQEFTDYLVGVIGLSEEEANTQFNNLVSSLEPEVTGTLTLNNDGTYNSNFAGGSDSGTWGLSTDEKTLTLIEGTDVIIISINSITVEILNASIADTFPQDLDGDHTTPDENVKVEAIVVFNKL